jgi:hypothetical protein
MTLAPDHAGGHAERDAILAELARLPARQRAVLVPVRAGWVSRRGPVVARLTRI